MEFVYKKKYLKYKSKYTNLQKNNINSNIKGGVSLVPKKAIAIFLNSKITGKVIFEEQENDLILVKVELEGFEREGKYGFHIHESGDLSQGCKSMCAHFNPTNKTHGGREDEERHVGDLGNLEVNSYGKVNFEFTDKFIKLRGEEFNIIGRGLVIHADEDDCGRGTEPDSKTTGHSGERIACAIIGLASNCAH